jgi:hypothetical protein
MQQQPAGDTPALHQHPAGLARLFESISTSHKWPIGGDADAATRSSQDAVNVFVFKNSD